MSACLACLLVGSLLIRSSSSASRVVQDVRDVYLGMSLGWLLMRLCLLLGIRFSRSSVDDFWSLWSKSAELASFFRAYYPRTGGPTEADSAAFLGRGLVRIRSRRLGGRAVGGRGSSRLYFGPVKVMRWM